MGALKSFKSFKSFKNLFQILPTSDARIWTTRAVQYGDLAPNRHRNRGLDDLLDSFADGLFAKLKEFESHVSIMLLMPSCYPHGHSNLPQHFSAEMIKNHFRFKLSISKMNHNELTPT